MSRLYILEIEALLNRPPTYLDTYLGTYGCQLCPKSAGFAEFKFHVLRRPLWSRVILYQEKSSHMTLVE